MSETMIPTEKKLEVLKNLLESQEFQSSKYKKLIEYLVNANINGEELKETTIAIDCFDKDSSFNPAIDSSVRVYLSNLRKKLEHYYLTDGKKDGLKLRIPKGHYQIEFITIDPVCEPGNHIFYKRGFFLSITLLIIFLGFAFLKGSFFSRLPANLIPKSDEIWTDFLTSETKTIIVLGDYFFFSMPYAEGRQSYIRDIEINSKADLDKFLLENPSYSEKMTPTYHTWLEENYPYCLAKILPSFAFSETNYEIKLSSEIQLADLQKYNIIYIGPYKCLNLLSNITENLNFSYHLHQGSSSLNFHEIESGVDHVYDWKTNPQTNGRNDFSIVLKVPGPNKNKFMFFISEHDFGNISSVKYFSNALKLQEFEKDLSSAHFEALFEVTGIIRTDFTIKMLHRNELQSDFKVNFGE
ncbi:MAG: hypothetical protein KKA84_15895 [Bacteroidetes bacterium]|nr:hypothetical protein [Bacteroidota bacterium]